MAPQRAQHDEVRVRTKRRRQKPVTGAGLEPLTVPAVALAPPGPLDGLSAAEAAVEATASSASHRGVQEAPVDAMVPVSLPQVINQSSGVWRAAVDVPQVRTIYWSSLSGTQTTSSWAPMSTPAACGFTVKLDEA